MKKILTLLALTVSVSTVNAEKHHEDPTKIITRAGTSIDSDGVGIRGSIGLDESRMINGSMKGNGDWRVGGSWLTDYGILNFNLDGNEDRFTYSVGTFVPLEVFGLDTGDWKVFPMAGANYTESRADNNTAYGGYVGAFAMRPITDEFTFMMYGGQTISEYSATWAGSGLSYKIGSKQSVRALAQYKSDSWEKHDMTFSLSYNYEF